MAAHRSGRIRIQFLAGSGFDLMGCIRTSGRIHQLCLKKHHQSIRGFKIFEKGQILMPFSGLAPSKLTNFPTKIKGQAMCAQRNRLIPLSMSDNNPRKIRKDSDRHNKISRLREPVVQLRDKMSLDGVDMIWYILCIQHLSPESLLVGSQRYRKR